MDVADPIPPSIKALVDLFKNELATVAFPGVDGALLEQLIADVQTYTDAVAKAEAALDAARASLRESEEVLAVKSQKALAYAKVYAADNPEIASKVDYVARIAGTSTTTSSSSRDKDRDAGSDGPKQRRGRPSKKAADATPAPPAVAEAAPSDATDMTPIAPAVIELGASETVADASPTDAESAVVAD